MLTDARHDLRSNLTLPAHGIVWLRPDPKSAIVEALGPAISPDGTPRVH